MKKLLLISSNSIHLYSFLKLIESHFNEIIIITNNEDIKYSHNTILTDFSYSIFNFLKTSNVIKKVISQFKPDIIHVHQVSSSALYTVLANKSFQIPIVLTAWGSDILVLPKKNIIYKLIVKFILKNSHYFSSDSKFMAEEMKVLCPEINSILIANFGIEIQTENICEKENIIYSNRLHKKLYRIDILIKSFSSLIKLQKYKDWKLVIGAIGEETNELKNLVLQLNLENNVKFVGWLDKKENMFWYSKAKFWISIPESDATSISLLEAMSNACIPILSDLPANREWVKHTENGWIVNELNDDFLLNALEFDYNNTIEINKLKVKKLASKEFNASKFIDLYNFILMKTKICHITTVHQNNDIRIFHKECISLAKNDQYSVSLLSTNSNEAIVNNVNLVSVIVNSKNRFSRMLSSNISAYKKAKKLNADIYHFHDPELLFVGYKLKKRGKIVIYDSHEDLPRQILGKYWIPTYLRKFLSIVMEFIENYISKRLSFIIVPTQKIKDRFSKINSNCNTIYNYPILNENKELPQWNKRFNNICYVGGINEMRGAYEMLDCLDFVKDVKLNLVGPIETHELKEKLQNHKNWNRVNYYGVLNREGVIDVLNKSKIGIVLLHPQENILDSLPIKMFEYMYAGLPIIASNFSLWNKIVNENECGICVNPLNLTEISNAIQSLLDNDSLSEKMGLNGRLAVIEKYNWENEENKLFKIYNDLLKNK